MKVLMCHNFYRLPGGEDQVFEDECWLLEEAGHDVIRYTAHSAAVEGMGRAELARKTFWNRDSYTAIGDLIRKCRPDVLHCANTFPLLSPAVYDAAASEGVSVVQTLHNFRLFCPAATMLREGKVCHRCQEKRFAWPGIVHGCYQGSRAASAVSAAMHGLHRLHGTWANKVHAYVALTRFSKMHFERAGLPAEKLHVKPNFVRPDPGFREQKDGYAVFVGRLSTEKGITTLLDAWDMVGSEVPLKIVGDGPLRPLVESRARSNAGIEYLGQQPFDQTLELIAAARLLVFPSIWYETFGRSMIEAKATGTPVVASNLGAMAELNEDEQTGLLFRPGDAADLADKVRRLRDDPVLASKLARRSRQQFEDDFTAKKNLELLIEIYHSAMEPV